MVNFSAIAIAALIAGSATAAAIPAKKPNFTAPSGNGTFSLIALAYDGDTSLSGLFPEPLHAGAGINVLRMIEISNIGGLSFNATTGDIYELVGEAPYLYPYTCNFDNFPPMDTVFASPPPKNYGWVNFDVVGTNAGFSFNTTSNLLLESSYAGKVLSICTLEPTSGQAPFLMFRNATTKASGKCADVRLKALFDGY